MADPIRSIAGDPDQPVSGSTDTETAEPGSLRGEVWLSVQTRQAKRLIYGRPASLDKAAIMGLVGFADRLRMIWQAVRDDDPYADWWLIKVDDALSKAREGIKAERLALEGCLKRLAALEIAVASSQKPYRMALKFANPYAYRGAQLIAEFDDLARTLLTCRHVGMLSTELTEQVLNQHARAIRGVFAIPQGYRLLKVDRPGVMRGSEPAIEAKQRMGQVPEAVLNGEMTAALTPRTAKFPAESRARLIPDTP